RPSCPAFHGRYRIAGAWRNAGDGGDHERAVAAFAADRHCACRGSGLGDFAGELFQSDQGKTTVSHNTLAPSLRGTWLERNPDRAAFLVGGIAGGNGRRGAGAVVAIPQSINSELVRDCSHSVRRPVVHTSA